MLSLCRMYARSRRTLFLLVLAAVLSLSVRASATEPDKLLLNKNAQALPIGLTFHPDVPKEIRKAIVDDLEWLSTRGPIKDERLRYLLQIDEPMTGASLVAWFLDRIHVVGLFGWCPQNDFAVIRVNSAAFAITKMRGRCIPPSAVMRAAVPGTKFARDPASDAVQAVVVGRKVRIVPETWPDGFEWPVMFVSPSFVVTDPSIPARVTRLGALLHESSHVEGIGHGTCKAGDWRQGRYTIGPLRLPQLSYGVGQRNCDDPNEGSANTIQASFLRALAEACHCAPLERLRIKFDAWGKWSMQGVPLKELTVVPSSGDLLSIKGFSGTTLHNFPPAEFMEDGLEYIDAFLKLCQNRCRQAEEFRNFRRQFVALREYGRDLNKRGAFTGSWEGSNPDRRPIKRPLDVAGARKWLAAAVKAEKDGYNVETMSLVSCADLQDQC